MTHLDWGLAGKVVAITGASGGIGRALAEAFGEAGCRLVLLGNRNIAQLETWSGEWFASQKGSLEEPLVLAADVTEPAQMEACIGKARERWGRVDVCVANAGVWPKADEALHEASVERLRQTINVNLLGSFWTARAFLSGLKATGPREDGHGASLIFTGSTAARFGESQHADYAAAKAGLVGLMLSLKNEIVGLDPYGRVNIVDPGWTVTHMVREELNKPGAITGAVRSMPLRQLARAADIARTALYLASPNLARHVSGQSICVAGGMEGRVQWDREDISEESIRSRLLED